MGNTNSISRSEQDYERNFEFAGLVRRFHRLRAGSGREWGEGRMGDPINQVPGHPTSFSWIGMLAPPADYSGKFAFPLPHSFQRQGPRLSTDADQCDGGFNGAAARSCDLADTTIRSAVGSLPSCIADTGYIGSTQRHSLCCIIEVGTPRGFFMRIVVLLACICYWLFLTVLLLVPNPAALVGLHEVPIFPWGSLEST